MQLSHVGESCASRKHHPKASEQYRKCDPGWRPGENGRSTKPRMQRCFCAQMQISVRRYLWVPRIFAHTFIRSVFLIVNKLNIVEFWDQSVQLAVPCCLCQHCLVQVACRQMLRLKSVLAGGGAVVVVEGTLTLEETASQIPLTYSALCAEMMFTYHPKIS